MGEIILLLLLGIEYYGVDNSCSNDFVLLTYMHDL
jgi:hypothetical protein